MKDGARVMTLQRSGLGNQFGRVHWVRGPAAGVFLDGNEVHPLAIAHLAEVPRPLTRAIWAAMPWRDQRAYVQEKHIKVRTSWSVAETETHGFGRLDSNGFLSFPATGTSQRRYLLHE